MRRMDRPDPGRKWVVLAAFGVLAGCSSEPEGAEGLRQAGIYLKSDVVGGTDVGGIRYEITPVDCGTGAPTGDPLVAVERELEDVLIPGGIGTLEDNPLDAGSAHLFADHFATLPAGCYDVTATPLTADGAVSADCRSATRRGVRVDEGVTTEIFLLNQCAGADPGALDAISTLNHQPEVSVHFPESKFGTCGAPRVMCATAVDPDRDPLRFDWTPGEGSPTAHGPTPVSRSVDPVSGAVTECVSFEPTESGRYDVNVRVYDLLHSGATTITIEEFLEARGYPSRSHASLDFFFYAGDCDSGMGGSTSTGGTGTGGLGEDGTGGTVEPGSDFHVEFVYLSPVSPEVRAVFEGAGRRWEEVIVGDVPDVDFSGFPVMACPFEGFPVVTDEIDDLRVYVDVSYIDGPGGILGAATPCLLRSITGHPVTAFIQIDSGDIAELFGSGDLDATILHELGHTLGIGTLWGPDGFDLLRNPSIGMPAGSVDTHFAGAQARAAFDAVGGASYPGLKVPVETSGGAGTADGHWRESVMHAELMTGWLNSGGDNPLSAVTVRSLADVGYVVAPHAADEYTLPPGAFARSDTSRVLHMERDVLDVPRVYVNSNGQIVGHH